MTETSIQQIFNSATGGSQEQFILCSEFLDYRIRIVILRNNNYPLLGEVATSELWRSYKETFPESEEDFKIETKKVLSGKVKNYKFYLQDNKLKWEKDLWTRGCIELFNETDISCLSDFMINVCSNIVQTHENVQSVDQENKSLKKSLEYLNSQLGQMIKMKQEMEEVLLKKFILVLNEKKQRIRELTEKNTKLKKKYEPSMYDLSTDEEVSGDEETIKQEPKPKCEEEIIKKEVESNSFDSSCEKISSHLRNQCLDPKPSTSKEDSNLELERGLSTPNRRKSLMDDELEDIINNVVNIVPASKKRIVDNSNVNIPRSAKIPRKCLSFEESDEDIELKLDSVDDLKMTQLHDEEQDMFL